ncbi:uncharacterized protein DNG_10159 [Cephalotrichum gorgonifer]|uniref:Peptidase S8/S53 domain-containing protein n=1 Tax=Cephalotrichum gorgonifer TaxID=2041049 RepID=A0AAE8N9A0_9PEZI|nr:uncharacterized protein DNG_10159 [Cephalotrichum gorgonifer]
MAPVHEKGDDSGTACQTIAQYTIWPRDGDNVDEAKATWEQMVDAIGNDTRIKNLQDHQFMVDFWYATLSEDEAQTIRELPNVSGVYAACKDCNFDPTTSWVYQREYPRQVSDPVDNNDGESHYIGHQQMAYLSYPPTKNNYFENLYIFDDSAGSDIPVYIVDTGAQLAHKEFTEGDNIASKVKWMLVGGSDFDGPAREDDSGTQPDGTCGSGLCKVHGTSMLGFVTGKHLGSSKNVEPWVVRVPRRLPDGGGSVPEDWVRAVTMINEKIQKKTEVTQAIVSLS